MVISNYRSQTVLYTSVQSWYGVMMSSKYVPSHLPTAPMALAGVQGICWQIFACVMTIRSSQTSGSLRKVNDEWRTAYMNDSLGEPNLCLKVFDDSESFFNEGIIIEHNFSCTRTPTSVIIIGQVVVQSSCWEGLPASSWISYPYIWALIHT